MNHFDRLSLPVGFDVDAALLETNYLQKSRDIHPDRFAGASPDQQTISLESSSALNEAYRTLKDPARRAEYLHSLLGGPSASEIKVVPQAFLMETMELRMELEELKETANTAGLAKFESELRTRKEALLREIGQEFTPPATSESLLSIRQKLNALKFVQGLLRDVADI
jgi:molecular chaperone HscB